MVNMGGWVKIVPPFHPASKIEPFLYIARKEAAGAEKGKRGLFKSARSGWREGRRSRGRKREKGTLQK